MRFADRTDAGRRLAAALAGKVAGDAVVLALPRGGVPVAAEIAKALGAPLDLVLVRKIGTPNEPELAMGAVADASRPLTVRNEDVIAALRISEAAFDAARDDELRELARRRAAYLAGRPPVPVAGRVAILVDDGIATGATTRAALRAVRRQAPSRLILAVPVAPPETLAALAGEADEIVCLEQPADLGSIGLSYDDFAQLDDRTVVRLLRENAGGQG